jgi:hypothetical protein
MGHTDILAYESARISAQKKLNVAHRKYINEFMRLKCSADMLTLGLFPNAKEITESFGAYNAVRDFCDFDLGDNNVDLIAIGDGHTPRTAATFAFRSKWWCTSIDPNLRNKSPKWTAIKRLTCLTDKAEHAGNKHLGSVKGVVVAVHSHAPLHLSLANLCRKYQELFIVAIPCCVGQHLYLTNKHGEHKREMPHMRYKDPGIWSQKREVYVWRKICGADIPAIDCEKLPHTGGNKKRSGREYIVV